ncbi:hypothetical protein [uncultured Actinomyces sp.]|uniref:hypothetical protein n=1 Tax=uncultured Actinomyces sp. TaxID=249061 RepID=UPI00261DFF07|nr:hypothetical protein [uncultured Actinomyces sp.]
MRPCMWEHAPRAGMIRPPPAPGRSTPDAPCACGDDVDLVAEDVDGVIPPRVGIITVFQHRQL